MGTPPHPVLFLPGILMPAALRYERLLEALGDDVRPLVKELEVYRGSTVPPPGYRFETEVEGISRAADEAGFDRFHLYGHSAGGACAIGFAAAHPERVLSLALDEPATDLSPEDLEEARAVYLPLLELPPDELMPAFTRTLFPEGIEPPPPPDEPPPWVADRVPGVAAFVRAMCDADVAFERLRGFDRPAFYSYGSLSNPTWARKAERLAATVPDLTIERFDGLSHLNASHIAEPERVAAALRTLWASA